ncbi:MAG: hypothetical protein L3J39_16535, partial [Verrucomicrobiales bacterium]|nr:hypothetical protein [Verrucomicrobiales bacterium]
SESVPLGQVLRVVFLGKAPCHRCLVVAEGVSQSQGEDKEVWEVSGMRLIHLLGEGALLLGRSKQMPMFVLSQDTLSAASRCDQPLTPPPRLFFYS